MSAPPSRAPRTLFASAPIYVFNRGTPSQVCLVFRARTSIPTDPSRILMRSQSGASLIPSRGAQPIVHGLPDMVPSALFPHTKDVPSTSPSNTTCTLEKISPQFSLVDSADPSHGSGRCVRGPHPPNAKRMNGPKYVHPPVGWWQYG